MKAIRLSLLLLLAAPATAHATDATIVARDLLGGPTRSTAATAAPKRFDLVGLHWQGSGTVTFRTHRVGGRWTAWHAAAPEPEDRPDMGGEASRPGWRLGNPFWTGPSDGIQLRTSGRVARVRGWFVTTTWARIPLRHVAIAGSPRTIPRAGWNADERAVRAAPRYAPVLRGVVVHHTAGSSDYRPEESAAIVRGIELYHIKANGWDDIGYNFLVDRYGQVFEGRGGGVDRNVIGAHAEGFNTGTSGIALLGTYSSRTPTRAAEQALASLIAWRLDVAHVDPASSSLVPSGGNPRFPVGTKVLLRAVSGHRDTGFTDCPGNRLYQRLGSIVEAAATTGLPKLYEPTVLGTIGGAVRISARLSQPLGWAVIVRGPQGKPLARKTGVGDRIRWTWDSSGLPKGRYVWRIEAGPEVRPAEGVVGQRGLRKPAPTPLPPLLTAFTVSPGIVSPNGDGFADTLGVSYVLGARAQVTASVVDQFGVPVGWLFADQWQSKGTPAFAWPLDNVPDGRYRVVVSARSEGGRTARVERPVVVSRALGWLRADPAVFSPDGDGAADTILFSFVLTQPATVTLELRQGGAPIGVLGSTLDLPAGDHGVVWDGLLPAGPAPVGSYELWVTALTAVGAVTQTVPFDLTRRLA